MKLNRRNFITSALAGLVALLAKLRGVSPKRQGLDAIDAMYYCGDEDEIAIAGMDGERSSIWCSTDDGETFYEVGSPSRSGRITAIATLSSGHWFVAYDDGELWESRDGGETWEHQKYEIVKLDQVTGGYC